ncbi:hypothetical protein ACHAL6_00840 [Proteiniclasticum sp. C24MP]|uniref:hypothetical protein n=1 Tax=Proteiniclasticum sp. C24MP TaxID=3374101 RepID=UPI00375451CD
MNKKAMTAMSVFLFFSMVLNIYLISEAREMSKGIIRNSNRLQYLEDNIDSAVADAVKNGGHVETILEDVNWTVSDLIDGEEKTAMLHIDFKLKSMDSTSKVYAAVEAGGEEAVLLEAHLLNDTTYTVDRKINVLEPVRIDLLVEKYGEKRLENLVDEEEVYRKYIADTAFNLLDFTSAYNEETSQLTASYDAEVVFSTKNMIELIRSDMVVEKNGIVLEKIPMETSDVKYPDQMVYESHIHDLKIEAKELDTINFSVIMKDKLGFTYRYDFGSFRYINGDPVVTTTALPELSLN